MTGIFVYYDPSQRDLSVRLGNAQGQVYDFAAKAWAANPSPANSAIPLHKFSSPGLDKFQACTLPPLSHQDLPAVAFVCTPDGNAVEQPQQILAPSTGLFVYGFGYYA